MTTEAENAIHIECANVEEENGTKSSLTSDSGFETFDMTSSGFSSYNTDILPVKTSETHENVLKLNVESFIGSSDENDGSSEISTPTSHSSEDKADGNVILNVCSSITINKSLNEISNGSENIHNFNQNFNQIIDRIPVTEYDNNQVDSDQPSCLVKPNLSIESCMTSSTFSLNEPNEQKSNVVSALSRSVENIATFNKINDDEVKLTKDLDQEKILSEFISQKNNASATQKIVPENAQLLDGRYARIPKEILSPDIGSIVKNVHGIFSSVSGSLKNAYNSSHRVTQKPITKLNKPVTNGQIMNNIFEEKYDENINDISKSQVGSINDEVEIKSISNELEQDGNVNNDMLKLQIESLERVLFEQRKENMSLRERVKQQCDELQSKDHTFKDLEAKVDLMCKRVEQAQKEKDAAVMRYASTECAAIEAKKAAETAAKAEHAAIVEKDLLNAKLKTARDEKQRICQLYDDKCHELQNSEREATKVREEFRELEGRLKWTQSKLRMEMDAYKESTERVEKLSQQITELEAAKEAAILNSADSARAKQFEIELQQSQAALILCRHDKDEFEKRLNTALQRLDTCKRERDEANTSLALANEQVESLKQSNMRLEEEAAELAALRAQAALADTLNAQLQRETERAWSAERALSAERARAETCARREAGALEHAARLTAAHVLERARAADHEGKAQALAADNTSLRETINILQEELSKTRSALVEETERRNQENRVLARKVAELTEEAAEANKKLEYEQGENNVLKKKHASAIKELNRELQRALKRIEILEAKVPQTESNSTRTGSISSLSSTDSPQEERVQNGHAEILPDVQTREPDRQALVERIVSLQRAAAARSERCEFLQEHCSQLTAELRRKAKLLRVLLPDLPCHALSTHSADRHKSEIAQLGGGAMAALWGGDTGGITLELSVEMNKRLQAVLEDTLLKNITLKENMDTLGEEISRLREQIKSNENK